MCYNVKVEKTARQLVDAFQLSLGDWEGPKDRITLSEPLPAIIQTDGGRELHGMRFGFTPFWWSRDSKGGPMPGNAKAETVFELPMFRDAIQRHRAIVPVTGFYEWIGEKGSKRLLPFTMPDREIMLLPAVWDTWRMPDGTARRSIATITCDPNDDIRPYHDRMPVILNDADSERWLSPDATRQELAALLGPVPMGELLAHPDQAFKPERV